MTFLHGSVGQRGLTDCSSWTRCDVISPSSIYNSSCVMQVAILMGEVALQHILVSSGYNTGDISWAIIMNMETQSAVNN